MLKIYAELAAMSPIELAILAQQLQFHPDPWAVGARKMVTHEILSIKHAGDSRNKIVII